MSITVLADVFSKILAVYTLLLIVASVILNPLVLFICLKSKKLRSTTTFKLLACAAINDLLVCLAWDQESFTNTFFQLYPYFKSLFYCRWISVFLQFTTNEIESWMLVSISLDRFLSLTFKKWNTHFFNGLKPFIFASVLAFVIAAINFIEGFTSGFSYFDNGTEVVVCFVTPPEFSIDWYTIMEQLSVYFGYIVPSGALIIINLAIIYKATKFDRAHKANQDTPNVIVEAQGARRKQEMTKTILIITFLYIVAAFPSNLVNGYFLLNVMNMDEGQLILNIVASVQFSYPAFNFFILFFSNKRFAHEVKELLTKFKNNSIGSSNNNNHVQTGSLHT